MLIESNVTNKIRWSFRVQNIPSRQHTPCMRLSLQQCSPAEEQTFSTSSVVSMSLLGNKCIVYQSDIHDLV